MSATRLWAAILGLWLGLGPGLARADDAAERTRIARERAEATALFEQRQRECGQRFAVTACVDQARAEHRQVLSRLRRQEGVLDEAQRKQRAAQRMADIREKVSAEEARERAPRPARREPELRASTPRPAASPREAATPASQASAAERSAREARSRARFEARQQQAQEQRDAAAKRQADRAAAGKTPAAPLPVPR